LRVCQTHKLARSNFSEERIRTWPLIHSQHTRGDRFSQNTISKRHATHVILALRGALFTARGTTGHVLQWHVQHVE